MRPYIVKAYQELPTDKRGQFAQIIAKRLVELKPGLSPQIEDRLNDTGWTISSGILVTNDPVVSEQFFPPGTAFDAYIAIRDILYRASTDLMIVDAYPSSEILTTVKSGPVQSLAVQFLTTDKGLNQRPDAVLEAQKFVQQFPASTVEIRTASDFHDRFIVINQTECYHVGASVKDAGTKAFVISGLQDQPIIDAVKKYIDAAWLNAKKIL
jgi:hypothetical protein